MKNKKWAVAIGGACLIVAVCFCIFQTGIIQAWSGGEVAIDPARYYKVTYVVDGDTFKASVNGREITVRVLGINTPETVDPRKPVECYGPEASVEGKLLLAGRSVELKLNPDREHRDKYGRYLLYVYRDDGLFYNEHMIAEGFAREYTVGSAYSFQGEFRKAETAAKTAGKGLWGKCDQTKS